MNMYLGQLKTWDDDKWARKLASFGLSQEEKAEVRQILTMPTKQNIESSFDRLKELGIINGIGPGYICSFFRWIISLTFYGVKYEWHDIMYFIGGSELDRLYADWGLLKYSLRTMQYNILIVLELEQNVFSRIVSVIVQLLLTIPQLIIALFCFLMVVIFGRFGSFEYNIYYIT